MNIDQYREMVKMEAQKAVAPTQENEEIQESASENIETQEEQTKQTLTEQKFEIDGKEVSFDELKNGYMRQSDYTKKTQSLADKRRENAEAIKVYERLKENPDLAERLKQMDGTDVFEPFDKTKQELTETKRQLKSLELNMEINELKHKYPDFNEVEVLNEANKRRLTDLEFVYKAIKSDKIIEQQPLNKDDLKEQLRKELLAELQAERSNTSTIIGTRGASAPQKTKVIRISEREAKIANAFGMKPEEYFKNK